MIIIVKIVFTEIMVNNTKSIGGNNNNNYNDNNDNGEVYLESITIREIVTSDSNSTKCKGLMTITIIIEWW